MVHAYGLLVTLRGAIGDYVLDPSVIAPLFFTGPNLSAKQKVHTVY